MDTTSIHDYAQMLMRKDGANMVVAGDFEQFYKGAGNLCLQAILAFENAGITDRATRLDLVTNTFDLTGVGSFKDLTLGQLKAIVHFKDSLKVIYA